MGRRWGGARDSRGAGGAGRGDGETKTTTKYRFIYLTRKTLFIKQRLPREGRTLRLLRAHDAGGTPTPRYSDYSRPWGLGRLPRDSGTAGKIRGVEDFLKLLMCVKFNPTLGT